MDDRPARHPRCILIAGPNGSGKTTFAREFLLREAGVTHFVNADLIAGGLSPLRPELATRQAGRLVLKELSRLASTRKNFAFESTLSGRTYLRLLNQWKSASYRIEIVFLSLPSIHLALQRIASRVRQGGHDVPKSDIIRRFDAGGETFMTCTALLLMHGQSMIILDLPHSCWRESHEDKATDGEYTICPERRARTAYSG